VSTIHQALTRSPAIGLRLGCQSKAACSLWHIVTVVSATLDWKENSFTRVPDMGHPAPVFTRTIWQNEAPCFHGHVPLTINFKKTCLQHTGKHTQSTSHPHWWRPFKVLTTLSKSRSFLRHISVIDCAKKTIIFLVATQRITSQHGSLDT
jgi:hypothetical protein